MYVSCVALFLKPFDCSSSSMNEIKHIFESKYRKTGVALTAHQLLELVKRKHKNLKDLPSKSEVYQFLRQQVPELGPFARHDHRPRHFQTIGVVKAGVYFVDFGEFHKSWARSNGGATGFLVAVENLSNKLFVLPTQGKDTRQWLNSIAQFVELTREVQIIYSDRDSVAQSLKFRDELQEKYGLRWYFLKKGNKSYLAERYIGFVKTKLSQALLSRPEGEKHWVQFVKPICDEYNSQIVPGTKFKRQAITRSNFDTFVSQVFQISDPSLERYNSFKAGPFLTPRWNRACFKFNLGDKVLLARDSNWKQRLEKGGIFNKVTHRGAFGNKVYTVAGRQLRANRDFSRFVPLYSLTEFDSARLHFYENELSLVKQPATSATADGGARSNEARNN